MRFSSLLFCFLLFGAVAAVGQVDTVAYTMQDTVVARRLMEEVKSLIGKRQLDEALEKAMVAERIYGQTIGVECREIADMEMASNVWHQIKRLNFQTSAKTVADVATLYDIETH
ncbi:MAG: hypothetical protein IPN76_22290 [Saprospiraceae bacterium]|nr:hypothetical protein [Saprospiraceae bacterium]